MSTSWRVRTPLINDLPPPPLTSSQVSRGQNLSRVPAGCSYIGLKPNNAKYRLTRYNRPCRASFNPLLKHPVYARVTSHLAPLLSHSLSPPSSAVRISRVPQKRVGRCDGNVRHAPTTFPYARRRRRSNKNLMVPSVRSHCIRTTYPNSLTTFFPV